MQVWRSRAACSWMAATTRSSPWPTFMTPMPPAKSISSRPSASTRRAPRADRAVVSPANWPTPRATTARRRSISFRLSLMVMLPFWRTRGAPDRRICHGNRFQGSGAGLPRVRRPRPTPVQRRTCERMPPFPQPAAPGGSRRPSAGPIPSRHPRGASIVREKGARCQSGAHPAPGRTLQQEGDDETISASHRP